MNEQVYVETTQVDADPQRVWEALVAVEAWPEWTSSMTRAELLNPPPLRLGSRVAIKQPRLAPAEMTVDEYVEGESFAWSSHMKGLRTLADHRVERTPAGSQVTLVLKQSGPLAGVVGLVYGRMIRRYLHLEASGLKRRSEMTPSPMGLGVARARAISWRQRVVAVVLLLVAGALSFPVVAAVADGPSTQGLIVWVHIGVMAVVGGVMGRLLPGLAGARSSRTRQGVVGALVGVAAALVAVALFYLLL